MLATCRAIVHGLFLVLLVGLATASGVRAAPLLTNGDFEDTTGWTVSGSGATPPPGWSLASGINPATPQSGAEAIGAVGTSALLRSSAGGRLYQTLSTRTDPAWQFDLDFAAADPGDSSVRSLNFGLFFATNLSGPRIHLRVNGDGDLQAYNGSSWRTPAGLAGVVSLDDHPSTTPQVNHVAIQGFFQLPLPLCQVRLTDAAGNVHRSFVRLYEEGMPAVGSGVGAVQFRTDASAADSLIDNAAIRSLPWRTGRVAAEHAGGSNPTSEGWTRTDSGTGAATAAVINDLDSGLDAWRIDDGGTTVRSFYSTTIDDEALAQAASFGWRLDALVRVTDTGLAPNNTRYVSFVEPGTGSPAREFGLDFGSDPDGNPIVQLRTSGTGPSYALDTDGYHLYSLLFDPGSQTASLFIDGSEMPVLSGYGGLAKSTALPDDAFVRFGSVNTSNLGAADYHLVQFAVLVPEPASLALFALGALVLVLRRRNGC